MELRPRDYEWIRQVAGRVGLVRAADLFIQRPPGRHIPAEPSTLPVCPRCKLPYTPGRCGRCGEHVASECRACHDRREHRFSPAHTPDSAFLANFAGLSSSCHLAPPGHAGARHDPDLAIMARWLWWAWHHDPHDSLKDVAKGLSSPSWTWRGNMPRTAHGIMAKAAALLLLDEHEWFAALFHAFAGGTYANPGIADRMELPHGRITTWARLRAFVAAEFERNHAQAAARLGYRDPSAITHLVAAFMADTGIRRSPRCRRGGGMGWLPTSKALNFRTMSRADYERQRTVLGGDEAGEARRRARGWNPFPARFRAENDTELLPEPEGPHQKLERVSTITVGADGKPGTLIDPDLGECRRKS